MTQTRSRSKKECSDTEESDGRKVLDSPTTPSKSGHLLDTVEAKVAAIEQFLGKFSERFTEDIPPLDSTTPQLHDLMARLDSLERRLISHNAPRQDSSSSLPKIQLPEFTIGDNPIMWLSRCTRLLQQIPTLPPEAQQVQYLTGLFCSSANVWWEGHLVEKPTCSHKTLEEFRDCLRRELIPPASARAAMSRIDTLKQRSPKDLDQYVEDFRSLIYQIPPEDITETVKVFWFQKGLASESTRARLAELEKPTLHAAILLAQSLQAASAFAGEKIIKSISGNSARSTVHVSAISARETEKLEIPESVFALMKEVGCLRHKSFSHRPSDCEAGRKGKSLN